MRLTTDTHSADSSPRLIINMIKVKVWTLAIAPLTWVRLVASSALQSHKWQLIGMSQWCRSALWGHSLPALVDNWTHSAASRHTTTPISHTRPSPRSRSYYSFPVPLRVGGWVGLSTQYVSNLLKVACSGPDVSRTRNLSELRVRLSDTQLNGYSSNRPWSFGSETVEARY